MLPASEFSIGSMPYSQSPSWTASKYCLERLASDWFRLWREIFQDGCFGISAGQTLVGNFHRITLPAHIPEVAAGDAVDELRRHLLRRQLAAQVGRPAAVGDCLV